MRLVRTTSFLALALGFVLLATNLGHAQSWPTRPVRFIVTLGPGSGTDIAARLVASALQEKWDKPVVIENRPGGDGLIAINAFVSSKDDHVLLFSAASVFAAHPYVHDSVPYRREDLVPVSRVSNTGVGLFVPSALPVSSIRELVDLVKKRAGELNWAGVTPGTDFLITAWLKQEGLDMKKVPYRNAVDAANDLSENRVQFYYSALAILQGHQQAGKVTPLAVSNSVRWPSIPEIPTATEAGAPMLALDGLIGLFGPTILPQSVRDQIAADIKEAMQKDGPVYKRLSATGQLPNPGDGAEFAADLARQRETFTKAASTIGVPAKW
jgi:tripartite-type tricarboxylate transporter receptor subunit TctC